MPHRAPLLIAALFVLSIGAWGLARASTPLLPRAYAPSIRADGGPTVTPAPSPTPTEIPVTLLTNGDFEQGAVFWQPQQFADVLIITDPPAPVTPRSGTHLLQLPFAQDGFATALDSASVLVPIAMPVLSYWVWVRSTEQACGNDIGGAAVGSAAHDTLVLCAANQTDRWVQRSLDLSAYAGSMVTIEFSVSSFSADTPGITHNSVLYIDDVGWRAKASTPTVTPTPTRDPALCAAEYPTVCIPPPPPDLNCGDITFRNFTVLPPDRHGLDLDHDGIGCEQ